MDFFIQNVLEKQSFGTSVHKVRDTTESIRMVARNPGGIGYASASEVVNQKLIRILPLAKGATPDFVSPCANDTCTTISKISFVSENYPLTRRLFVVIKRDGGLDEKAGIAYANMLLSDEGQKLIEEKGFVFIR